MALWRNLQNMDELTYWVMKRGFQLSALLLAIGCQAIRLGELITADLFRQLSASALLLTVATRLKLGRFWENLFCGGSTALSPSHS